MQTLIEVRLDDGSPFGLVHVVRDADVRGVPEITAELRATKDDVAATASGRALRRFGPMAGRIPESSPRCTRSWRGRSACAGRSARCR